MTLATRLLRGYVGGVGETELPASWGFSRYAGNPNIYNFGAETLEMYVPAPLRLANGDIWVYVKGGARIYAWMSPDDGETFTYQNGGGQVVGPGASGAWDDAFVLEPTVLYDEANATIHLWYKGTGDPTGATGWAWGHATAPDTDPTLFTKDAANPILTGSTVSTALGGATVTDLAIGDVIKIGSTFHFYGYAHVTDRYRLIHATGTTWNDPGSVTSILTASNTTTHWVVQCPSVFRMPGGGTPLYVMFYADGAAQPDPRTIRLGTSTDGVTWDFSDTTDILSPTSGWESNEVYCAHLLKRTVSPWTAPYVDGSGRWLYYYSGLDNSGHAQSGLVYMTPA